MATPPGAATAPFVLFLTRNLRVVFAVSVALCAAAFFAGHVTSVRRTLDGIDSTNFILAVDRYSPQLHQPHPPGFPVHVALGRAVTAAYRAIATGTTQIGVAAASLRVWSAICGALTLPVVVWLAREIGIASLGGVMITLLIATCPLFWLTAMRPLSDVPGLLFCLLAQAMALFAYGRGTRGGDVQAEEFRPQRRRDYLWVVAGLFSGIAAGVRVQTALLTLPLLTLLVAHHAIKRRSRSAVILRVLGGLAFGIVVWAVPMAAVIGGPAEYLRLVTTAGADDIQGVEMLATHPAPGLFVRALVRTFVVPWGLPVIGWSAVALSALGAIALARHNRRALVVTAVLALPYLLFHLLFQETASIRYALPLVPVSAILIAANLMWRPTGLVIALLAILVATNGVVSARAANAYRNIESPVARALDDLKLELGSRSRPPTLASHHAVGRAIRAENWSGDVLAAPVRYEWLRLAYNWLAGEREPIWFLADPRRSDLALIDPASRRLVRSYEWPKSDAALLGGVQPPRVGWYEITPPGWFLMEGWGLTPETRGVAQRDGRGPALDGIIGYVRRRTTPAVMMIGGRNFGGACDTSATIEVLLDGRKKVAWVAPPQTSFLQVIDLAPGELDGEGDYAMVKVRAINAAESGGMVDVAIEQFDVQSPGHALVAYDRGWQVQELDPETGITWRWTDVAADLRTESFGRDIELVIEGESPLHYFQEPPQVEIRAGAAALASYRPAADFAWTVSVPAAVLAAADGRVTIQSDRTFVGDDVFHNGDQRRMALRIYSVHVRPLPPLTATR